MTRTLTFLALAFGVASTAPAAAEDAPFEQRLDQLTDQAGRLFDHLADRLGPTLESLGAEITDGVGKLSGYHPPEILPNGDIILRKIQPQDATERDDDEEDGVSL